MELSGMMELAGKAFAFGDIGPDTAKFLLAWFMVKGTIKGHLSSIEGSLKSITSKIGDLKDSMEKMETAHARRLDNLEIEVKSLKEKDDGKTV